MKDSEFSGQPAQAVDVGEVLGVLRERKWIIVGLVVLAFAASLGWSLARPTTYQATAKIVRQNTTLDQALFGAQVFDIYDQQRALSTGAQLVKLHDVGEMVLKDIGSSRTLSSLELMVKVSAQAAADIVDISAVSTDPQEAAAVANSYARQFILYRQTTDREILANARDMVQAQLDAMSLQELQSTRGTTLSQKVEELAVLESMQTGGYGLAQQATPPTAAYSPHTYRDGAIAVVAGLVLGLGLAFLLHVLDRRIKTEDVAELEFGVPVIASIPLVGRRWNSDREKRSAAPVGFADPESPMAEAFGTLRSNLKFFETGRDIRRILVTSALPREGKTVTAVNLALSLAMSGVRVIILEADLRRPMLHEYLGLSNQVGLTSLLTASASISEATQMVNISALLPFDRHAKGASSVKNLLCVTAGPLPPNPAELLGTPIATEVIDRLSSMCDYMVVDAPPLLLVPDTLEIAKKVDGVVLVAHLGGTTVDEARRVRQSLQRIGVKPLGLALSGVTRTKAYYRRYSGYYINRA
jgi:succinoglycan biosynthesis transport protein ExoP